MRTLTRGASHWPFIICLVLLLVFVFLWYDQKGDADKTHATVDSQAKLLEADKTQFTAWEEWGDAVSNVVGWRSKPVIAGGKPMSDPAKIAEALNPDKDSPFKAMKDASVVAVAGQAWKPGKGIAVPNTSVVKLSEAFKNKLKEVNAAYPKEGPPAEPVDDDDAAAKAGYAAKKAAYDEQFAKYRALVDDLVKNPEFKDYPAVLGDVALWDPDKVTPFAWSFWERPATPVDTLEVFVGIPALILKNIRDSYIERAASDMKIMDGQAQQIAQQKKMIDNADEADPGLTQKLAKEQDVHTADVNRLQKEAADARAETEKLRVSETGAQQSLAQLKETSKKAIDTANQTIQAQRDRIVGDKEVRELEIQRDEPDGTLRGADEVLGTGYISLGNQDKVYPGLKFQVSYIGRGGMRVPKGEVVVTKVLDAHYSQVRILSQVSGERPMGAGDLISNPFFNKNRPIHVYIGNGDFRKYPRAIAAERLARMGVIVEDKIWEKTDYVLIPDSLTVKPSGEAPAAGTDAAAGAAKPESELDRLSRLAHTFGATLITERMIESFLDY